MESQVHFKFIPALPLGDKAVSTDQIPVAAEDQPEADLDNRSSTAYLWAMLIARIYEIYPLICPQCGGELTIVAFLTESDSIQRLLIHIGEPVTPPQIALARLPVRRTLTGGPPDWSEADFDQTYPNDSEQAEPVPEYEFDQTVSW